MARSATLDMTQGSLSRQIISFSMPLMFTNLLQMLFSMVDLAVVGRFSSAAAMGSVGSTTTLIFLFTGFLMGLGSGVNVLVATHFGARSEKNVRESVHTSFIVCLAAGFLMLALGLIFARPLLELLGTRDDLIDGAELYLRIYFLGMPFVMLYNFGSAILRSKGDTRRPLWCLAVGSILNIGLDLFVVRVLGMGIAGITFATLISYALSAGLIVMCLLREEGPFHLELARLKPSRKQLTDILKMGVPAGLQGAVFSFSNLIIQSGINGFGEAAMSGSAAELNYEFASYFMAAAFASAAVTFTSQNFAVRKYDRCKRVFALCMVCGVVSAGLLSLLFVANNRFFIGLCASDPDAITYGMERMLLVEAFEWVVCSYEVTAGALRGMKHSLLPTAIILFGTVGMRMVFFFTIFAAHPDFNLLMHVYLGTWAPTGVAMLVAYFLVCRKAFKPAADKPAGAQAA